MFWLLSYLLRKWRERGARPLGISAEASPEASPGAEASEASPATAGRASAPRVVDPEVARPSAAARGTAALLLHQVRYDLLTSLRNPRARFFTFFFPIVLLVVFTGVFGSGHTVVDGVRVDLSRFYVPGILAMSIVVAAYANLVISITSLRETGVLKRRRATPVSPGLLVAGQAMATVVVALVMGTLLLVIAKFALRRGHVAGRTGRDGDHRRGRHARVRVHRLRGIDPRRLARRRPADRPGHDASAVVHLRRVHPDRDPERDAALGRVTVPGRTHRRRDAPGVGALLVQQRDLGTRPARARRLGRGRRTLLRLAVQLAPQHRYGVRRVAALQTARAQHDRTVRSISLKSFQSDQFASVITSRRIATTLHR